MDKARATDWRQGVHIMGGDRVEVKLVSLREVQGIILSPHHP